MADTQIITEKELNYIETLYLYANLQDFINPSEFPEIDGYGAYIIMLKWVHDNLLCHAELISSSDTKSIYRMPNYRLLISDYDLAKRSNTFNVEIQYEWEHLYTRNQDLSNLDLPFGGTHDQYDIKRIDITKIAKHEKDYLTDTKFISKYRKIHREGTEEKTETVYLGNRANGNVVRMYDKTKELRDKQLDLKIDMLGDYFGDIENLYTYELELHRKALRTSFNMIKLSDVYKAKDIYSNVFGGIRIYRDTPKNKKLKDQKHPEKISANIITSYKDYERLTRKRYKASERHLVRKTKKSLDKYFDAMGIEATPVNVLSILLKVYDSYEFDQDIIEINFQDSMALDRYNDMKEKHERLRDGNDELQSEAWNAFKPVRKIIDGGNTGGLKKGNGEEGNNRREESLFD